jgi:hypothetical protein
MKIVFFAIIIYGAYLILRYIFRTLGSTPVKKDQTKGTESQNISRRRVDPNNIEDADFEEIKKD